MFDGEVQRSDNLLVDLERDRQDRLVECMAVAGFEYRPLPTEQAVITQGPGSILYEYEPGTPDWYRHYGLGITTLAAPQSELEPGLIGMVYEQPPTDFIDPNSEYIESLDDAGREAWSDQLDRCRLDVDVALAEREKDKQLQRAGGASPELQAKADENTRALIDLEPEIIAESERFYGCLANAGFPVGPTADVQGAVGDFIIARYPDLLDKVWFRRFPLTADDVEALRDAQRWEQSLGAALVQCDIDRMLSVVRPIADRIRGEQLAILTNTG